MLWVYLVGAAAVGLAVGIVIGAHLCGMEAARLERELRMARALNVEWFLKTGEPLYPLSRGADGHVRVVPGIYDQEHEAS